MSLLCQGQLFQDGEICEKSRTMREYMIFVDKVRRYSENQPLEAAIEQTVDECIQEDVLRDFLLTHKAEVKKLRKV